VVLDDDKSRALRKARRARENSETTHVTGAAPP